MAISPRLRSLFTDYLAQNSTMGEIEQEFEAAGITHQVLSRPVGGGQRRNSIAGYYQGLDFAKPADIRKFLNVLSVFMANIESFINAPASYEDARATHQQHFNDFQQQLRRDGYAYDDGAIMPVGGASRVADLKAIAAQFDAGHFSDQLRRIEASIDSDPALAIGTAKELTESCFKTILGERGITYTKTDTLPQLSKKTFAALKLLPDDIPDAAKGASTIKVMLSNLANIVQGVAEIRSLYGTGHGRDGKARGVTPRHARLAVGAAATLVNFAFETHLASPPTTSAAAAPVPETS